MNPVIDDESIQRGIDYINNFLDFMVRDRKKMTDIIILLMVQSGNYDVEIPVKELMEIKTGMSIFTSVENTENGWEDGILKFGLQFTDEQREKLKREHSGDM